MRTLTLLAALLFVALQAQAQSLEERADQALQELPPAPADTPGTALATSASRGSVEIRKTPHTGSAVFAEHISDDLYETQILPEPMKGNMFSSHGYRSVALSSLQSVGEWRKEYKFGSIQKFWVHVPFLGLHFIGQNYVSGPFCTAKGDITEHITAQILSRKKG
ncbi:hypothetical protein HPG69_009518 [Diceros bicornis minor]|uniref:Alpha-defensin N-terminal domain-containing protein n=1 Tax=Diceros bicornis minor TaxID=77932 RepID=A0A7J7F370_DICBM|nr:hypothetical protein HPG69_009518 [Diceros bicornis minor]